MNLSSIKLQDYYRIIALFFLFGLPVYGFTFYILNNFFISDSYGYSSYWDFAKSASSLSVAHGALLGYLGSDDLGYTLIIWLAAKLPFSRYEFLSILNALVVTLTIFFFCKKSSQLPIFYGILFLGYYFPSLIIAPERLHLSVFLIIISFFFSSYPIRLSITVLAILTHSSSSFFLLGIYIYLYYDQLKLVFIRFFSGRLASTYVWRLPVLVLFCVLFIFFNSFILVKISSYVSFYFGLKQISAVVLVVIAYYFRIASAPLALSCACTLLCSFAVLGAYIDRTLMFLYFLYVIDYLALNKHNRQQNLAFAFLLLWTASKSLVFYADILNGGGGYGSS